jgi:hypothetical protein
LPGADPIDRLCHVWTGARTIPPALALDEPGEESGSVMIEPMHRFLVSVRRDLTDDERVVIGGTTIEAYGRADYAGPAPDGEPLEHSGTRLWLRVRAADEDDARRQVADALNLNDDDAAALDVNRGGE